MVWWGRHFTLSICEVSTVERCQDIFLVFKSVGGVPYAGDGVYQACLALVSGVSQFPYTVLETVPKGLGGDSEGIDVG